MKVYTRRGDAGETSLIGGTRVSKASLRIECYGTIDELNSYIGLIRDQKIDETSLNQLLEIQDRLFTLGSLLASDPEKSKMKLPQIKQRDIDNLEKWIDEMDQVLPPMKFFVLPGGHPIISHTHVARCICRRGERLLVELMATSPVEPILESYVNRLSDYLFVLSRKFALDLNATEIPWHPKLED